MVFEHDDEKPYEIVWFLRLQNSAPLAQGRWLATQASLSPHGVAQDLHTQIVAALGTGRGLRVFAVRRSRTVGRRCVATSKPYEFIGF